MARQANVKKSASAFRTISEVARELDVQQHVLRFWETKFTQIKPLKRGGGRRYYRPEDITLLRHIHDLLYTQGYTIKGVQNLLKGKTKSQIAANLNDGAESVQPASKPVKTKTEGNVTSISVSHKASLRSMLSDLKDVRKMLGNKS